MARIFMDGFESGDFGLWSTANAFPTINNSKSGRIGIYCAALAVDASGEDSLFYSLPTSKSSLYFAAIYSFKTQMANSYSYRCLGFYNGGTVLGCLTFFSSGILVAVQGTSSIGSSTKVCGISATSEWNLIEVYYLPHISAGSFIVKINGIVDINLTGIQTAPSTLNITKISFESNNNFAFYLDNVIFDDANWIGPSSIQGLVPTGAGATTQFDPSTGSNYACVDEIPPSDADYISTNVANEIDTYVCGDLTGTINSVKAVQVQARCVQEGSPAVPKIQLITRPTSTDRVSASKDVQTFQPSSVANIWELNPDDSAAWESADVNGMEIGVKAVAS